MFTENTDTKILLEEIYRMRKYVGSYNKLLKLAGNRFGSYQRQTVYSWIKCLRRGTAKKRMIISVVSFLNITRNKIGVPEYSITEDSEKLYITSLLQNTPSLSSSKKSEKNQQNIIPVLSCARASLSISTKEAALTEFTEDDLRFLTDLLTISNKPLTFKDVYLVLCTCRARRQG